MNASDVLTKCEPFLHENLRRLGWFFAYYDTRDLKSNGQSSIILYKVLPIFTTVLCIDILICCLKGGTKTPRVNLTVIGTGITMFSIVSSVLLKGFAYTLGIWIHDNYALTSLNSRSTSTWILAVILMDFGIYWAHRALHEFNVLWVAHQMHHAHDQINLAAGGRFHFIDTIIYVTPCFVWSLFIEFEVLIIALQSITFFSLFLHRNFLETLGPLDYVFTSPRAHQLHHAMNRKCIDKNFGFLLCIWDKIFGTYVETDDQIYFGITTPLETYNFWLMTYLPLVDLLKKIKNSATLGDKLKALFYGPGWAAGKPRLGHLEDVPEIGAAKIFNPLIGFGLKFYIGINCIVGLFLLSLMVNVGDLMLVVSNESILGFAFFLVTLVAFGMFFDRSAFAPHMEVVRCATTYSFINVALVPNLHMLPSGLPSSTMSDLLQILVAYHKLCMAYWIGFIVFQSSGQAKAKEQNVANAATQPFYEKLVWLAICLTCLTLVLTMHLAAENVECLQSLLPTYTGRQ